MIKYWFLNNITTVILMFITIILTTVLLFKSDNQVVVIAVDRYGTRVLNDSKADQELKEQETVQFINEFITFYFNFNELNFKNQIDSASGYLSEDLWNNSELELYKKLTEEMKLKPFEVKSKLVKLEQDEVTKSFTAVIGSELIRKGISQQKIQSIKISIKNLPRTKNNPWGAEIYELNRNI